MVWGLKRFGPSLKWPVGIRLGTTQLYWNMIKITMTYVARPPEEARRLRLALFLAVVWCTTAEILLFSKYPEVAGHDTKAFVSEIPAPWWHSIVSERTSTRLLSCVE